MYEYGVPVLSTQYLYCTLITDTVSRISDTVHIRRIPAHHASRITDAIRVRNEHQYKYTGAITRYYY